MTSVSVHLQDPAMSAHKVMLVVLFPQHTCLLLVASADHIEDIQNCLVTFRGYTARRGQGSCTGWAGGSPLVTLERQVPVCMLVAHRTHVVLLAATKRDKLKASSITHSLMPNLCSGMRNFIAGSMRLDQCKSQHSRLGKDDTQHHRHHLSRPNGHECWL